jgi:RNA polymerase sigma-70 factor (ECF subfamily)
MHRPHRSKSTPLSRPQAEAEFNRLYGEYGRDVLAYALARTPRSEDAADVVAETFLVAWRRAADVPAGPTARLWLFGVARRVLANQRRGEGRRTRLAERLQTELPAAVALQPEASARSAVMSALSRLGEEDREVLLLAGWEGLGSAQIAEVLGVSRVAARTRLHRARRRLRKELVSKEDGVAVPCTGELEARCGSVRSRGPSRAHTRSTERRSRGCRWRRPRPSWSARSSLIPRRHRRSMPPLSLSTARTPPGGGLASPASPPPAPSPRQPSSA